jgi:serine/threonine-protein kinase
MDTDDLRVLDRLLDEALALPPHERGPWLERLSPQHARLVPTLRDLLAADVTEIIDRPLASRGGGETTHQALSAGATVGPYRLLRELGVGGMGVVWLAERIDRLIDRPVALKLPLFPMHHRALGERFARERVILARLAHPNIARLYDAGISADGQPYLALEYVEGEPLTEWCDARRSTLRERIALVVQVLRAVQYAHANLVIHRDLKPSNILVTAAGEVRLLDFGIAKLVSDDTAGATELTRLAGRALTPSYAAPELIAGQPIGIASDVYSIGVILYELLSGARPYRPRDRSAAALEAAVLDDEPVRPSLAAGDPAAEKRGIAGAKKLAASLAGDLDTIIIKALKKNPEERYPTAAALAEDLERHLRGDAINARADSALYRATKLVLRHRAGFGAAVLVAFALIAGTWVAIWQAREARHEAARANAVQAFVVDLFRANTVDQPDPQRARQTTARELLDRGAARIAQSLGEQPQARLQLLETLALLYAELGLFAEASELGAQRIELARVLYGRDDLRVAEAIGDQVAWVDARAGVAPASVDALIREALRIHDAHGDATSVVRARLHERASAHLVDHALPAAVEHAERAVGIFRAHHATSHDYPQALAALGNARQRQGDWAAALATYEEALAVARRLQVADHRLLFYLRRAGETNAFLDNGEKADALLREALALSERINGAKHPATVAIRMTLARNLAWMSRLDEAATQAARAIADAESGESRETYVLLMTYRLLFDVHWARGDLAAAREGNDAAFAAYGATMPDSFDLADLKIQRALLQSAYGRHREAMTTIAQAAEVTKRLGARRESLLYGNLVLHEAQVRLAAGDARGARDRFREQREYWPAGAPGVAASRAELNAGLVDALLALGEVDEARRLAQEATDELARVPGRRYLVEADAVVERALARVLIALHECDQALPHLDRAATLYAGIHIAESPARADIEALRADCTRRLAGKR